MNINEFPARIEEGETIEGIEIQKGPDEGTQPLEWNLPVAMRYYWLARSLKLCGERMKEDQGSE